MVYCPKGINNENYNFLTNIFQTWSNNNKDCVIMGDFNCNTINKYDPSTHDFLSLATSNSFHPLHYLPTRGNEKSASTLDIIFTNMSCLPGIIIDDILDHFPIFAIFNKPSPDKITKTLSQELYKRNFSVCSIQNFSFCFTVNIVKMFTIIIHLIIILLSASLKTLTFVFKKYVLGHLLMAKNGSHQRSNWHVIQKISYVKDT